MGLSRCTVVTLLVWGAVSGMCLSGIAPAHGQSSDPKSAKEHYRLGAKAFRQGDTESAIHHFRRAYELKPDGMLLYNLALVHTAAGRPEKALWFARRAETSGDLTDHASVRNTSRLAGLRVATTAANLGPTSDTADNDQTRSPTGRDETERSKIRPPQSDSSSARPVMWGGLSVAGLGLAGLGGAAGIELSLRDDIEEFKADARAGRTDDYRAARSDIRSRQRLGRVLLVGGAIASGLGLTVAAIDAANRDTSPSFRLGALPASGPETGWLVTLTSDF